MQAIEPKCLRDPFGPIDAMLPCIPICQPKKEVERYTKAADQNRLAEQAVEKLKRTQIEQKT